MGEETIRLDGQEVALSHVDKSFFPEAGLSKGDLIDYYRRISEVMIPHMQGHPISMQRFPDGIEGEGFYQKEAPAYFPGWITRAQILVEEDQSRQEQVVCDDAATLVYLANQACITPHLWLSRADRLDHPDKLIFDLDPPTGDFESVRAGALHLRQMLEELGLIPHCMTTGSRGLHVVAPLDRGADFDTVRQFTRDLAELLVRQQPDRFTVEMKKADRGDRLFLDYLRNAYGQTAVAPYAVRAKAGAPVATPLSWDELHDKDLNSQRYHVRNIFRRLGQKADPWQHLRRDARALDEPRQQLDRLLAQHS